MSATITYNGSTIASVGDGTSVTLNTQGKLMSGNVTVEDNSMVWTEQTISTAGAVTQALDPYVMYHFTGALTALTITLNAPASGQIAQYHFDFNCGSTAPTVTIPATVTMPDGNSFDANKHYEADILNSYGVVAAWNS